MRSFRRGLFALTLSLSSLGVGCAEPETAQDEPLRTIAAPIINGTKDSTDDAVVAVLWFAPDQSSYTECTGTIISTSGTTGYALTAAHCCPTDTPPQYIARGDHFLQTSASDTGVKYYQVLQYEKHPSYTIGGDANQPFDFCMVTFQGEANMPVIPAMTPANDSYTPGGTGTQMRQVGFGQTTRAPSGTGNNITRNQVTSAVLGFETNYQVVFSETPGGTCFGDSGGPDLVAGADGATAVYGVHSNVSGNCDANGQSVSGVVSTVFNSFITPYLQGTPPTQDCSGCIASAQGPGGACASQTTACGQNAECGALITCLNGCGTNATCQSGCSTSHPTGIAGYNAIIACICDTGCTTACSTECTPTTTSTFATGGSTTGVGGAGPTSSATGVGGGGEPTSTTGASEGSGTNHHGGKDNAASDDVSSDGGCSTSGGSSSGGGGAAGFVIALATLALAKRRR